MLGESEGTAIRRFAAMSKGKLICGLLVLVFLAGGIATFPRWVRLLYPQYTAKALIYLAPSASTIIPNSNAKYDPIEFENFRDTQKGLITSRFVIMAALRDPRLRDRPCIKREDEKHDTIDWLTGEIQVCFPSKSASLMQVSATETNKEDAAAIVNAVIGAYKKEVLEYELERRRARLSELQKASADKESEVRTKREQLKHELENGGLSDDEQTMAIRKNLAVNTYVDCQRELQRMKADNRSLAGRLKEARALLQDLPNEEIAAIDVASLLSGNPQYQSLRNRIAAIEESSGHNRPAAPADANKPAEPDRKLVEPDPSPADLRKLKTQLSEMEGMAAEEIRSAARIGIERDIRHLQAQFEVSTEQFQLFEKEVEKRSIEMDSFGKTSIAAQMARADVELQERILGLLAEERERLKIDLSSAPRVIIHGDQNSPAAVPESPD